MAIGKMADLVDAAQGRFKPRSIPAMEQQNTDIGGALGQAYERRKERSITPGQLAQMGGQYQPPGYIEPATASYRQLLGGYRPSPAGLTSKGKYGGFMTVADRDAAIAGAAMEISQGAPAMLRSQAAPRYQQLQEMLAKSPMQSMVRQYVRGSGSARSPRMFEEASQARVPGIREYAAQLSDWYTKNVAPAEEFLTTAQQIEATPVSQLAASIAANAYGMNPQLARGKFAGLDKTAFEERRNLQSMQTYGIPYSEYEYMQQEGKRALADQKTQEDQYVEQVTGTPLSQIIDRSGMNREAIINAASQQNIKMSETETGNVVDLVNLGMQYINTGEMDSVNELLAGIEQYPGQADVARLIRAILGNEARKRERSTTYLEDYASAIAP